MLNFELKIKNSKLIIVPFLVHLLAAPLLVFSGQPVDLEEQTRRIASELRCVVCQNLSVADSPSELAQQMRVLILQQLQEGRSPDEIKAYFVSKYGEWVLLAPPAKGFNLLIWVLPVIAPVAGLLVAVFVMRRWTRKRGEARRSGVDPPSMELVKREAAELEFEYQAGKLSEPDYKELRQELEKDAAIAVEERGLAAQAIVSPPAPRPPGKTEGGGGAYRRWQLVTGGIFLLLFGITLGVLLTKSLRPRLSEQDTITGDFLTGTQTGDDLESLLRRGRAAFERKEWSQAIDAFKKALAIDGANPGAHAYMGLILTQAGHADGALSAFERALATEPNYPIALWGKGMILYRVKEDYSAARQTLDKLVKIMPAGAQRDEIQNVIAELDGRQKAPPKLTKAGAGPIRGTVSVDPRLKERVNGRAVLFIVARAADSPAGPPLAVKKIERPSFPLTFTIGPQDVMIEGRSFSGKVLISARLDKDGNAVTRDPGDLMGEYKKNPVEAGSQNADIVLDRVQ